MTTGNENEKIRKDEKKKKGNGEDENFPFSRGFGTGKRTNKKQKRENGLLRKNFDMRRKKKTQIFYELQNANGKHNFWPSDETNIKKYKRY